MADLSIDQVNN